MQERYSMQVKQLLRAVLTGPGATEATLRETIECFSAAQSDSTHVIAQEIPPILQPYVANVMHHAYKVLDADIQSLLDAGYDEEMIYEITVSAALGSGMGRLERGLAALQEGGE